MQIQLMQGGDSLDKHQKTTEILRRQQCSLCPLLKIKTEEQDKYLKSPPTEILILSEKTPNLIGGGNLGYSAKHVFAVECGVPDQHKDAARQCCLGRKEDLIIRNSPKLLITIGSSLFAQMESIFGHEAPGLQDGLFFPTKFRGHTFWHVCIPDFSPKLTLLDLKDKIKWAMENPPVVFKGNYDGVELITTKEGLDKARHLLSKSKFLGWDIETVGFRPYNGNPVLTMALSSFEHTFALPVKHPQTPSQWNPNWAWELLRELYLDSERRIIAHNAPFELEWLAYNLGKDALYEGNWHDTMAQAYSLANGSLGLNALIRRHFGFSLKKISNIDVENLINTPIDQVMSYNALDAKYTQLLYFTQQKALKDENLEHIYEMQRERSRAVVSMQNRGLCPNPEFIEAETQKRELKLEALKLEFNQLPEVQRHIRIHSACNPASDKDVKMLHIEQLGINPAQSSFDEAFLSPLPYQASHLILKIRAENKNLSTYLIPYNKKSSHPNAGKFVHRDGIIHPIFNTMKTKTARLSSEEPNAQNQPSGVMKYMRNVVKTFENEFSDNEEQSFLSADYGQIEYRFIAALSEDPVMINAINEGRDIHGFWATRIDEMFPKLFLKKQGYPCTKDSEKSIPCDPMCDKCEFKDFRGRCKNQIVFPFCFGSSSSSVAVSMGIDDRKMSKIADIFWEEHKRVKQWHSESHSKMDKFGYVVNAYGRKYRGPLDHNKLINYPIQGSNGDLVNNKMAQLSRIAYERKEPWLCPVLNEHDNLMFSIPKEKFQEASEICLRVMLDRSDMPWFPVPLLVEAEYGHTWGGLKTLGEFSSEKIGK